MFGTLEKEFDYLLEQEAVRIMGRLLVMYEEKEKVNKSFQQLVASLAKEKYSYFWVELVCKINKLLPYMLIEDITKEYSLTTREEYHEQYLDSYKKYNRSSKKSNLFKTAEEMATYIINFCHENPTCNEDLLQVMTDFMPKVLPEHNESIDCQMIIMYLQQEINRQGHNIISLAPIRIEII